MLPARPTRLRRAAGALVVAVALGVLAGCSQHAPSVDELTDAFVTSGLPEGRARCVSEALTKVLSDKELELLAERGASAAPYDDPNRTDDSADRLREAFTTCTDQAIADGEITTTTAATVPTTAGATSTTTASSTTAAG